jgi:hypothetical protein
MPYETVSFEENKLRSSSWPSIPVLVSRNVSMSWALWLTPVILYTQEAEIRRIIVWRQPGQANISRNSLKYPSHTHQKKAGEVAKGVGPEFKLQCWKKKKKERKKKCKKSISMEQVGIGRKKRRSFVSRKFEKPWVKWNKLGFFSGEIYRTLTSWHWLWHSWGTGFIAVALVIEPQALFFFRCLMDLVFFSTRVGSAASDTLKIHTEEDY